MEAAPLVGAVGQAEAGVVAGLRMALGQLAHEVAVEVLLGGQPGAPGGDAAGAVVDGAEHGRPGRVGGGLQPRMAGRRAGDRHRRVGGDAAVLRPIGDDTPLAVDLPDLDDGAAMGGHLDRHPPGVGGSGRDLVLRRLLLAADDGGRGRDGDEVGEHQVRVGVLVVDHEQAVLGGAVDGEVADVVGVVAELPGLRLGALVQRIERRGVGEDGVAPAEQHVGVVAFGDMVVGIDAGGHFGKVETRDGLAGGAGGGDHRERPDGGGDRRRREGALQHRPAREPGGDDLAHGRGRGRVPPRTVGVLELAGAEMRAGRLVVHGRLHRWMNRPGAESIWLCLPG